MTKFMLKKFIQTALLLVVLCTTATTYAQVSQAPDGMTEPTIESIRDYVYKKTGVRM